ncbi:unnamed protein product, partial [Ranitomeya imitator]
ARATTISDVICGRFIRPVVKGVTSWLQNALLWRPEHFLSCFQETGGMDAERAADVPGSGVRLRPEPRAERGPEHLPAAAAERYAAVPGLLLGQDPGGPEGDYYIAQGTEAGEELRGRRTFYSLNCLDWCLLSPPTDDIIREARLIKGRFIGDPAHEYELTVRRKAGEGTEVYEEGDGGVSSDRHNRTDRSLLRGGCGPPGGVHQEPTGTGPHKPQLPRRSLCWRRPTRTRPIDFLDSLPQDIPTGCWSLQCEQGSSVVVLRSLLWLGMTFYHVPSHPAARLCIYRERRAEYRPALHDLRRRQPAPNVRTSTAFPGDDERD